MPLCRLSGNTMEFRKLISFGKNSYVISLPKHWVKQNNLQKGALLSVDVRDTNLLVSPHDLKESEEREISIQIDGKSVRRLQREIISAYINDYKSITLYGEEMKEKAKEIQATIQNLMALEVMEQTSKKIVARDFLNMDNISITNLIRKIDVILRSLLEDCINMFEEDTYDSIYHRDQDVNRLSFLVFRVIEFGLRNPSFMYKKHNLRSHDMLHLWWFVFNLEGAADETKRIARYMRGVKLKKSEQAFLVDLLRNTKEAYIKVMKSFYQKDAEIAHAILELKTDRVKQCEDFYLANKDLDFVGSLAERVKSIVNIVHNLGRVVYQADFTVK